MHEIKIGQLLLYYFYLNLSVHNNQNVYMDKIFLMHVYNSLFFKQILQKI